jgi:hypothetical protein
MRIVPLTEKLWFSTDNAMSFKQYLDFPYCDKCADRPIYCTHRHSASQTFKIPQPPPRYVYINDGVSKSTSFQENGTITPIESRSRKPSVFEGHRLAPGGTGGMPAVTEDSDHALNAAHLHTGLSSIGKNHAWTHIRLAPPNLSFQSAINLHNAVFLQKVEKDRKKNSKLRMLINEQRYITFSDAASISGREDDDSPAKETLSDSDTEDLNPKASRPFRILWKDYYRKRKGTKPNIGRSIPVDKLVQIIYELYDERYQIEEQAELFGLPDMPPVFLDYFYQFLEQRYSLRAITLQVAHDILASLQKEEHTNRNVELFVRLLCGEDDVTWKYIMLARQLYGRFEIFDIEAYRRIMHTMYPYRAVSVYVASGPFVMIFTWFDTE